MPHEKVAEDIEIEIKRIEKLIENYRPLLQKVKIQEPNFIRKPLSVVSGATPDTL